MTNSQNIFRVMNHGRIIIKWIINFIDKVLLSICEMYRMKHTIWLNDKQSIYFSSLDFLKFNNKKYTWFHL